MNRIRLPLPYWCNEANLAALARHAGWHFVESRQEGDSASSSIWSTGDNATFVSFVTDFALDLQYVVVQGASSDPVADLLRAELPVIARETVLRRAGEAADAEVRARTVCMAAVTGDEGAEDPELLRVFLQSFADPVPEVRRAAAFACTYLAWRGFEAPLERLAREDPDEDVRGTAEAALDSLRRLAWGTG